MYSPLTASEAYRSYEIQNHSLVFEPTTNHNFAIQYNLFTVNPGQQQAPSLLITAPFSSSNSITIEKDIHVFDDEDKANEFINSLSEGTQFAIHRRSIAHYLFGDIINIEVHIVNYPKFDINFDYINQNIIDGFYVRAYQSGSFPNGSNIREISDRIETNEDGEIISETYLNYFMLHSDK